VIRRTLEVDRASEVPLAQNAMSDADYEGFTEILGKLVVEQDDATRAELSTELQQYVLEHNAAFPLYDRQQQAAFAPDVHGAEFTADGMIRFHDLWLDR
jgi:MarR-like DNA-binding transcriptional regulator SgrR of sgrS sRNA